MNFKNKFLWIVLFTPSLHNYFIGQTAIQVPQQEKINNTIINNPMFAKFTVSFSLSWWIKFKLKFKSWSISEEKSENTNTIIKKFLNNNINLIDFSLAELKQHEYTFSYENENITMNLNEIRTYITNTQTRINEHWKQMGQKKSINKDTNEQENYYGNLDLSLYFNENLQNTLKIKANSEKFLEIFNKIFEVFNYNIQKKIFLTDNLKVLYEKINELSQKKKCLIPKDKLNLIDRDFDLTLRSLKLNNKDYSKTQELSEVIKSDLNDKTKTNETLLKSLSEIGNSLKKIDESLTYPNEAVRKEFYDAFINFTTIYKIVEGIDASNESFYYKEPEDKYWNCNTPKEFYAIIINLSHLKLKLESLHLQLEKNEQKLKTYVENLEKTILIMPNINQDKLNAKLEELSRYNTLPFKLINLCTNVTDTELDTLKKACQTKLSESRSMRYNNKNEKESELNKAREELKNAQNKREIYEKTEHFINGHGKFKSNNHGSFKIKDIQKLLESIQKLKLDSWIYTKSENLNEIIFNLLISNKLIKQFKIENNWFYGIRCENKEDSEIKYGLVINSNNKNIIEQLNTFCYNITNLK